MEHSKPDLEATNPPPQHQIETTPYPVINQRMVQLAMIMYDIIWFRSPLLRTLSNIIFKCRSTSPEPTSANPPSSSTPPPSATWGSSSSSPKSTSSTLSSPPSTSSSLSSKFCSKKESIGHPTTPGALWWWISSRGQPPWDWGYTTCYTSRRTSILSRCSCWRRSWPARCACNPVITQKAP